MYTIYFCFMLLYTTVYTKQTKTPSFIFQSFIFPLKLMSWLFLMFGRGRGHEQSVRNHLYVVSEAEGDVTGFSGLLYQCPW